MEKQLGKSIGEALKDANLQLKECFNDAFDGMKMKLGKMLDTTSKLLEKEVGEYFNVHMKAIEERLEERFANRVKDAERQLEKRYTKEIGDMRQDHLKQGFELIAFMEQRSAKHVTMMEDIRKEFEKSVAEKFVFAEKGQVDVAENSTALPPSSNTNQRDLVSPISRARASNRVLLLTFLSKRQKRLAPLRVINRETISHSI